MMAASLKSVGSSMSGSISKNDQFLAQYHAQCQRHNSKPLREIKVQSNHVLSFIGDRITLTDWLPLLKTIKRDRSLHYISIRSRHSSRTVVLEHVTTLSKAKELSRGSVLFTKYLIDLLLDALAEIVSESKALRCLELQKIPISNEIGLLADAFTKTKSLQHIVLKGCSLGDQGCLLLARALRNSPSVMSIDFTGNGLTCNGAEHVAGLIKTQEVARYNECWKHSLRYRDVAYEVIPGLRRITLNDNPEIGDKGLRALVEVLYDDYWIKAVDMQNCSITDRGCTLVEDLIKLNKEIIIFDIRCNPIVDSSIASLVQTLASNANAADKAQYGWIDVATSRASTAGSASEIGYNSSKSNYSMADSVNKVKNYVKQNSAMFDGTVCRCRSAGTIAFNEQLERRPPPISLRTRSSSALTKNPRPETLKKSRDKDTTKNSSMNCQKTLSCTDLRKMSVQEKQSKTSSSPKNESNERKKSEEALHNIAEIRESNFFNKTPRDFTETFSISSSSSDSDSFLGPSFNDVGNRRLKAIFKDYIKTQNSARKNKFKSTGEFSLSTPSSFFLP